MKLIILNKDDSNGGAARAAVGLHRTMLSFNVNSTFLVEKQYNQDQNTVSPLSKAAKIYNLFKTFFDSAYLTWKYPNRKNYPWGINILPTNMHKVINKLNPDIVNLHWISFETISWKEIAKINAPIVWTMHDMWALTGGCHYTYGCEKYLTHCGNCPQLGSSDNKDISYKTFEKKKKLLTEKNITVVASSLWLYNCFKNSPLFKDLPIHLVPNPIDTKYYKPIDKKLARSVLNLPVDKKLVLFMAFSPTTDTRKGIQYFPNMLKSLGEKYTENDLEIVIAGASHGSIQTKFNLNFFGILKDDWSLALLYSACDVLIAPSVQENLSNAVMEAMACETPVVAFNIGGMPDMIQHKTTGYLATPFDAEDLANGIDYVIQNPELREAGRKFVNENFSREVVYNKMISIYKSLIK